MIYFPKLSEDNPIQRQVGMEELMRRSAKAMEEYLKNPNPTSHAAWCWNQHAYSVYLSGDNTLAQAESQGALNGKKLYPDLQYQSVVEYAKAFYA